MKTWKFKGNRIRASDKSLVYHFCIGWLLLLFVAVFRSVTESATASCYRLERL